MRKLVSYLMDEMKRFEVGINLEHLKVLRFLEYYVDGDSVSDMGRWLTVEVAYRNRGRNKYNVSVVDKAQLDGNGRLVYMVREKLSEHEMLDLIKRLITARTWEEVETDNPVEIITS